MAQASPGVRLEWARRAEAEARSATTAEALALALDALGGLTAFADRARAVAREEERHAQLSAEVLRLAGGPAWAGERPAPARSSAALEQAVALCLSDFCLGETLAVPLFARLRARATVPEVRAALTEILRDEAGHRALGWELLEALLSSRHGEAVRALVRAWAPEALARTAQPLRAAARASRALPESDQAWGLMAPSEYVEALDETVSKWWCPRLAALGLVAA